MGFRVHSKQVREGTSKRENPVCLLIILLSSQGITIDDGWDQLNRSFMFVLLVVMGTTVTVRQYTGSVISCDGFKKFGSTFAEVK